jgi:IS6 family transposase
MILSAIAAKLKHRAKGDFKGRHYEAALIVQAVSWYLRYPLSYRDIEELFLERGLEVDHSTLNRWVAVTRSYRSTTASTRSRPRSHI